MNSGRLFDKSIKSLLKRVFLLVSLLWLSVVGVLASRGPTTTSPTISHVKNHQVDTIGRGKLLARTEVDINYMSKRKVPNGPDPIHNRRAGNSRRPPGQA
ncbi:hypothetical protein BVRB_6g155330 [Beta vulgaris subsp. vulgaris]|nr:hypothetical protein BVRB_6g155330 [Beta vulgaris subsp. vulgaris]